MKIYQFNYNGSYGDGVLLVAAENEEEAINIKNFDYEYYYPDYCSENVHIVAKQEYSGVILECHYIE